MTPNEAFRILGLSPDSTFTEIKKKYRSLMQQVHPDAGVNAGNNYAYNAHEINTAYAILKKMNGTGFRTTKEASHENNCSSKKKKPVIWNAPVNPFAYCSREILQYAEGYDGNQIGHFCIASGKYLWSTDEDFSLFLLSMYRCSSKLLDKADASLRRNKAFKLRSTILPELTYLLAQQFIAGTELLKELAREEMADSSGNKIFYIAAMLEYSDTVVSPKDGEMLYPSKMQQHRLYLKNQNGQEIGYLSFPDDRLYYVVIPLFEQRIVQIKIQSADRQTQKSGTRNTSCHALHVWIKLQNNISPKAPENLNLKIKQLLDRYRETEIVNQSL